MIARLERIVFAGRPWILLFFVVTTLFMAWSASHLRVDAGFNKLLPLKHAYMQTFSKYSKSFGAANRILIALTVEKGDIFTPEFFQALKKATDDVFFISGVERASVTSLFTPNVRFTEVVEDGISGGNVIPSDFRPTPEGLAKVRENILKSNIVGRLVANDFTGAIISAQLMEINPNTGQRLDYIHVADELEKIRQGFHGINVDIGMDTRIIGFAKVVSDINNGATRVVMFFVLAFFITALFVYIYTRSFWRTLIPLACSLIAVIWQLGLLTLIGFGIDPMSILVPFLVFAIGVSHGVQMISANGAEIYNGADSLSAARASFRRLFIPGAIALASDTIGFITILLIEIRIIQETAITASLGVAVIILTNLFLLPILLSYLQVDERYRQRLQHRSSGMNWLWQHVARIAERGKARIVIGIALVLLVLGTWLAADIKIGDLHHGVPELREDSRYNIDSKVISDRFSIGVDVLSVITETVPNGCIEHDAMALIDDFVWHMRNVEGVQSVIALASIAKVINAGWNEGSLKWRVLPRNKSTMAQAVAYVDTSTGLLNPDCSVMPVLIFTSDHEATTISRIVAKVKEFSSAHSQERVKFRLAAGNVGVMAATNEAVDAAQFPILFYVFAAIIILCLVTFRSFAAVLCIVLPLGLVSVLAYALMSLLEIGLKVSTLPVVALGVGIGVDYGIYIYSRLQDILKQGLPLTEAYRKTLSITGNGVMFTGITLAVGVATWIFSPLKFQADMGILLTFMFLVNMLGAILLLPALASWLLPLRRHENS